MSKNPRPPKLAIVTSAEPTERQLSVDAADILTDLENVLQVCVGALRDPANDNSEHVAGVLIRNVLKPLNDLLEANDSLEGDAEVSHA